MGFGNVTVKFNLLFCLFWVCDFVVVAFEGFFHSYLGSKKDLLSYLKDMPQITKVFSAIQY